MNRETQDTENVVIDASMSYDGFLCFCPIEGDLDGEYSIITGMNYLTNELRPHWKLVAIIHPDGRRAVEEWCAANKDLLDGLRS